MDLQELVDGAAEGAVVTLPAGTWTGTLVVTRAVTLAGAGAGKTVVDAAGKGPCLFVDAPGATVRVTGVSLVRGSSPRGGGVCFQAGRLQLEDAVVENGSCLAFGGGGLFLGGEQATLVRVQVSKCLAGQGGGVLVDGECSAEFLACVLTRNAAEVGGGLRLVEAARARLVHCTVAGNGGRGKGPLGPEIAVSGTSTRRPHLEILNSIVAPTGGAATAVLQLGEFPGGFALSHSLVPQGSELQGPGVRFGAPDFMPTGGHRCALGPGSPAAAGADAKSTPEGLTDVRGRPLRRGAEADMGAYAAA
jgi:hypothetical protein